MRIVAMQLRLSRQRKCVVLLVCALGFATQSIAQTACPIGVGAGSAQCGPSMQAGPAPQAAVEPQPLGRWIKTWGAISIGDDVGAIGASTEQLSKRAAQKDAVDRCIAQGGHACKVVFTYRNQCMAIAWPKEQGLDASMDGSADLEDAKKTALSNCENGHPGQCKIIYSDCSAPHFEYF